MAMWQTLSLRARLNTLLALVMVLGLVINVARLLLEASHDTHYRWEEFRFVHCHLAFVRLVLGHGANLVCFELTARSPDCHS